jgi:hypothetical protein
LYPGEEYRSVLSAVIDIEIFIEISKVVIVCCIAVFSYAYIKRFTAKIGS